MMPTAPDGTAYDLAGRSDGPCIVFIHGLGLNRACWQWTIPALADDYRILSYDLYGHGASADPPETPSLSLFSRQLRDLMDHCDAADAAIVGFSLGGMIARRFAQDTPHRARALAVLHSPHRRTPEAQAAILARVDQARDAGSAATVEAALERWFTDGFRAANPDIMDKVRGWVLANRKEVYHTIYRVLAEGVDEIVAPDPAISRPTLVITGDEDYGNGPEKTHAIANEIEGAEALILPGLRHMALAEEPEAINGPLRAFLDRTRSQ
ncbi:MAG: alpha/beta hydrolase [Pseudomonadota bacterium]